MDRYNFRREVKTFSSRVSRSRGETRKKENIYTEEQKKEANERLKKYWQQAKTRSVKHTQRLSSMVRTWPNRNGTCLGTLGTCLSISFGLHSSIILDHLSPSGNVPCPVLFQGRHWTEQGRVDDVANAL